MTEPDVRAPEASASPWRMDRQVSVAVIFALLVQTGGALLWAGGAAERIAAIERRLALPDGDAVTLDAIARFSMTGATSEFPITVTNHLADPATNLKWGLKYLAGAHRKAGGDLCRTTMKFQAGHAVDKQTAVHTAYCGKVKSVMASL